jgi:NADH:ubiquinone oxidoreductase subunit H
VVLRIDLTLYDQTQKVVWLSWLLPGLAVLWWVSSVAETNRSPFDFANFDRSVQVKCTRCSCQM